MPHRKWVFDTASLSNFLLSDSISVLETRFRQKAMITSQVYEEISEGITKYPKLKSIDGLIQTKIYKLCALTGIEREIYAGLIGHLGKGEASCIAIAKNQSAIIVTDDRTARRQCSEIDILCIKGVFYHVEKDRPYKDGKLESADGTF